MNPYVLQYMLTNSRWNALQSRKMPARPPALVPKLEALVPLVFLDFVQVRPVKVLALGACWCLVVVVLSQN